MKAQKRTRPLTEALKRTRPLNEAWKTEAQKTEEILTEFLGAVALLRLPKIKDRR